MLRLIQTFILCVGISFLASGITGIQRVRGSITQNDSSFSVQKQSSTPIRITTALLGGFLLGVFYGVLKRRLWAWKAVFVLLLLTGVAVLVQGFLGLTGTSAVSEQIWIVISQSLLSVIIFVSVIKVWLPQKSHFNEEGSSA